MQLPTVTALFLIIVPIAFNVTFIMLAREFEYPDILRQPTDTILRKFKAGGPHRRGLWYGFMFSALLFAPVPVMVQQVFLKPICPGSCQWVLLWGRIGGARSRFWD